MGARDERNARRVASSQQAMATAPLAVMRRITLWLLAAFVLGLLLGLVL